MKIYTRTGDEGSTGLFGGPRVSKDDGRIEAYGTVDELNAAIGVARAHGAGVQLDGQLAQIQHELFSIGAELATPDPGRHDMRIISDENVQRLERQIDEHNERLPELKQFILPAGSVVASSLHLARAICRRAERRVVTLSQHDQAAGASTKISRELLVYLNRLSDLLFVMSRAANHDAGDSEVPWERPT